MRHDDATLLLRLLTGQGGSVTLNLHYTCRRDLCIAEKLKAK